MKWTIMTTVMPSWLWRGGRGRLSLSSLSGGSPDISAALDQAQWGPRQHVKARYKVMVDDDGDSGAAVRNGSKCQLPSLMCGYLHDAN